MFNLKNMAKGAAISAVAISVMATSAMADKVLRIQSVLGDNADEVFMLKEFGKGEMTFDITRTSINGDHAYIFWNAQTEDNDYHIGTDTFIIHDGKIVYQTFSAHITPR